MPHNQNIAHAQGLAPDAPTAEQAAAGLESFYEKIKFIQRAKYHASQTVTMQPYNFIVAGEVYIPGHMVKMYELRMGAMLRGMCKDAAAGARLPYRAVTVDEHVSESA